MHTIHDRKKLLHRISRISGQVDAIKSAIERGDPDCTSVLQTAAACRGAINGLMAQIIEGHIREHVLDPHERLSPERARATQELLQVVKSYLK